LILIITGHLGSGKSLLAVRIAHDYLKAGKKVASNITLNLDHLMPPRSKVSATKLPYIPTAEHLEFLGKGYEGDYDEDKFGLLLLDEAGTWLNSRDWADKDRRGLFTWITHARKHGWDVALIIQDFEALDAQIRRSVTEIFIKCVRLDRVKVPYLPIKLPRILVGKGLYGGPQGMPYKSWMARGDDYFKAYDTREAIRPETLWTEAGPIDIRAMSTMLPAWHLVGRYLPPRPGALAWISFGVKWGMWGLLSLLNPLSGRRTERGDRWRQAWREDLCQFFPGYYPELVKQLYDRRMSAPTRRAVEAGAVVAHRLVAESHEEYRLKRLQGTL